jgi:hypothetical protein
MSGENLRTVARRLLVALLMGATVLTSASSVYAQGCEVSVTAPLVGHQVGRQGLVAGKAVLPPEGHLWVLVHIRGLNGYWPQGGGPTEVVAGDWEVLAFYGQDRDIGMQFEIVTAVVDQNTNTRLRQWVQQGLETGSYPPISFPNTVTGCVPVKVAVTKASH